MAQLVLIRGIPGSGKTTMAKNRFPDHILVEADMFFYKDDEYRYDPSKIKDAHAWCQQQTIKLLKEGNDVVVANTFIKKWEMQPYIDMGYPTRIIEAKGKFKNTHGVPDHVVERMMSRFER